MLAPPAASGPGVVKPPWQTALEARSKALNQIYGLPTSTAPTAPAGGGGGGGSATPPPPSAGASAPPSGTGSIDFGGYTPDYAALLSADPSTIRSLGDLSAYQNQLGDARSSAIKRAVVAAGFAPPGVTGDIDQATLDAAKQNQFSTAADLEKQRSTGSADLAARLAARGILDSGALTGGQQLVDKNYERGTSTAMQQLLAAISGYQGDFNDKSFQLMLQKAGLTEAAAARIAQDPRYRPTDPTHAVLDPASGLYKTADGRWYTQDGQPADAPADPSAPAAPAVTDPAAYSPAQVQDAAAVSNQEFLARQAAQAAQGYHTAGF